MDTNKELERLLGEMMSTESVEMENPSPALVFAAREKIRARKKTVNQRYGFFESVMAYFKLNFKVYHVGFSLMLITAGVFYLNEPNYSNSNSSGFIEYQDALSITNTTISVNSTTMLTSIPTMVIRN